MDIWKEILISQIETGTPIHKDAAELNQIKRIWESTRSSSTFVLKSLNTVIIKSMLVVPLPHSLTSFVEPFDKSEIKSVEIYTEL